MSDIKHNDEINEFEIEITDLELTDEVSNAPHTWLNAQRVLAKIRWRDIYVSGVRTLLLLVVFLVPLIIGTSYGPEQATVKNSRQQNCNGVIYVNAVAQRTVTPVSSSSYVTVGVITVTVQSSDGSVSSSSSTSSSSKAPLHGCKMRFFG